MTAGDERSGTNAGGTPGDPEVFGPYLVYDRLGVGGMATVHRAKERGIEDFERIVALKRLLPHLAEDASFVRSFVREAKLASMLQHVNIVQLYELGRVGHVYFISMEHIDGRDIRKILRQARKVSGPPTVNVVVSLLTQICDALDYAHTRVDENNQSIGIVHRDISPSNLLVTKQGYVKVIDFGIAKAQSVHLKTQTGRVKGKLAYMAPEAILGKELDGRSDMFSVGVIAHELLTARPLFATKNEYQTLLKVQREEVPPPSQFNQAVPAELDAIVGRALAKDPDQRFTSAAEMRDELHDVRIRYGMSATNREVASWMDWAFSLEAPSANFSGPMYTDSLQAASISQSRSPAPLPGGKLVATFSGATPASTGIPELRTRAASPSGAVGAEEEAANIAWGADDEEKHVLLDDVPDLAKSHRMPLDGIHDSARASRPGAQVRPQNWPDGTGDMGSGPVRRRMSTQQSVAATVEEVEVSSATFGAGIVPRAPSSRSKLIVIGALLAAAAAAAFFLLRDNHKTPAPPVVEAPQTATLKFIVEPPDAVVRIPGLEPHTGSPYTIEIEPGTVQIEVQHANYKSYVTSIENLEAGDSKTIRVMLERASATNLATLKVDSTFAGVTVFLDGTKLEQALPLQMELSPGAHVLSAIDGSGGEFWRNEFIAAANTVHEFHANLEKKKSDSSHDDKRIAGGAAAAAAARAAAAAAAGTSAPLTTAVEDESMPTPGGGRSRSESVGSTVGSVGGIDVKPPPGPEKKPEKLDSLPPAPEKKIEAPKAVIVAPNAVTRSSGSVPTLKTRTADAMPKNVSAKLCINTSGSVTSVSVLSNLPDDAKGQLQNALKSWKYQPYKDGGKAVPACFIVAFSNK